MQKGNVVRGNTVPAGGVTPPVVGGVAGGGMLLPDTLQLQEMADIFFENSEQNYIELNEVQLIPGGQQQFTLKNVGLGESMELWVEGSFKLRNDHATIAQDVEIAPEFPFNLISNYSMVFNGKTSLANASGYELLGMMLKRRLNNDIVKSFQSGRSPVAEYMRVDKRIANINVSAGTLTAGETLTGYSSLTIPAVTTVTVNFEMYLQVGFTLRKDLPIGLVPMQNNNIYANISINTKHIMGATIDFPIGKSTSTDITVVDTPVDKPDIRLTPTYSFWGLPANPALYNFFVNNSYVITTLPKNPVTSTGNRALKFSFPQNYWLISALFTIRDVNQKLLNVRDRINYPHVVYNGTVTVDRTQVKTRIAREVVETGAQYPYGILIFDGAQTNNMNGNSANMSKWLNMYQANNPMFYADVDLGVAMPGNFDVLLEQIVPNHVEII